MTKENIKQAGAELASVVFLGYRSEVVVLLYLMGPSTLSWVIVELLEKDMTLKIKVFKRWSPKKNWNLQTKLNNSAFESNAEIRLESTFTTWWDKAEYKARSVALKL